MACHKRVRSLPGLIIVASVLLAACTSGPTAYQPFDGKHGYTSEIIADDLVTVRFRGNTETGEDAVEDGLFRRVVEIAEARGAGSFIFVDTRTECVTTLKTSPTTTCTYRQSADAMFPYYFGVYEVESPWHASPQREYEAVATVRFSPEPDCTGVANCHVTAEVSAR